MIERPLPNSYWVLGGRFLAGEYPLSRSDEADHERHEEIPRAIEHENRDIELQRAIDANQHHERSDEHDRAQRLWPDAHCPTREERGAK